MFLQYLYKMIQLNRQYLQKYDSVKTLYKFKTANICPKVFFTGCPPPSQYWPWLAGRSAVIVSLLTNYFHLKNKIVFTFSSVIFQKGINKGRRIRTRRVSLKSSNILVSKYFSCCSNALTHW